MKLKIRIFENEVILGSFGITISVGPKKALDLYILI
jgi:hypothetical protein